ncbi:thiol reductase thioredoxin [Bacillus pseudomycoides]|nr:thiol reductase thioredoxin [Bacillus pseudomycoides]
MRLIKFEKSNCPKCVMLQNLLDDHGVKTEKIDVENYSDIEFIAKYVDMSLPVLVLLNDNEELVMKSAGFNPDELNEIVSKLA